MHALRSSHGCMETFSGHVVFEVVDIDCSFVLLLVLAKFLGLKFFELMK